VTTNPRPPLKEPAGSFRRRPIGDSYLPNTGVCVPRAMREAPERQSGRLSRVGIEGFCGHLFSRRGRKTRPEKVLDATASRNVLGDSEPGPL
jgi:hypothetical protein